MKQTGKRQLLLLGTAALAAICLSLYDQYGNLFQTVRTMAVPETEDTGQKHFMQQVLQENARARQAEGDTKQTEPQTEPPTESQTERQTKDQHTETGTAQNPDIRVLICNDNYAGEFHNSLTIRSTAPFTVSYEGGTDSYGAGDVVYLDAESPCLRNGSAVFSMKENGVFQLPLLQRSQPCPSYEGKLTVEKREEGLLLVNTLPLETYLCYVVPSEMPSSYPIEALKAQAVCARCYALRQMEGDRCSNLGADLDDSVSYQVYNNIGKSAESIQAVQETAGFLMKEEGEIKNALYYSTSCGIRLEEDLSEEAVFCSFLTGDSDAYEESEPWYRWEVTFSPEKLTALAETAWPGQIGNVRGLSIPERDSSGCASAMVVSGDKGEARLDGEYAIRTFLNPNGISVTLQDGSEAPGLGMLPSAFFYITPVYEGEALSGFLLKGGGYGHGNGMSQNGAKHMALDGKSFQEILKYYYGDGVEVICAL